jgi:hypothetical protein
MTPGMLNYWASMLKDQTSGVTVDNPPTHHFFDAGGTRAAPKTRSRQVETTQSATTSAPSKKTKETRIFHPDRSMPSIVLLPRV